MEGKGVFFYREQITTLAGGRVVPVSGSNGLFVTGLTQCVEKKIAFQTSTERYIRMKIFLGSQIQNWNSSFQKNNVQVIKFLC